MDHHDRHQHDLAFYFGLNAVLLVIVALSIWLAWPLQ